MSPLTVKWHGAEVKAHERAGAARGLYLAAEHVLEKATRIVPVAPSGGTLQDSGVASVDAGALRAAVSYDTPYAVIQHERLDFQHTRPGAQAKYLEQPLNSERAKCETIIAAEIRKSLGA